MNSIFSAGRWGSAAPRSQPWMKGMCGMAMLEVGDPPVVNHLLEFLYATDRRDFDAALSHFEHDSVVAAADLNGGVPMDFAEFAASINRWIETSADAPERQHECDTVMMSPNACFIEGFVTSERMPPRYFVCSAKLGSSGRIRRYSFLSWSVDEATVAAIRTATWSPCREPSS
jgi:hypothetical protein